MYINIQGLNDNQLFWLTHLTTDSDEAGEKEIFNSLKHLTSKELVKRFVARKTWLINFFQSFEAQVHQTCIEGTKTKIAIVKSLSDRSRVLIINTPVSTDQDSVLHLECMAYEFIHQDYTGGGIEDVDFATCSTYPDVIQKLHLNSYSETGLRFNTLEYDAICNDQCYRLQGTNDKVDYKELRKELRKFEIYNPKMDFSMFRDFFLYD